ncbi:efflux RND transporter periplasmic adaptor subunit [Lacrimispora sp.]|uniref:efflux RND transporter periplasmic adaptor subunit n=1 Tax=Lacrimispora sp. TaxID=2719234 RepID=UPI0032E49EF4|nr:HlyD family efflux transporter periplasmic adaptor subunit [Paenibacillaceae bacterium]
MQENKHINIEDQEISKGTGKLKKVLIPLLLAVILLGGATAGYFYYVSTNYFKTDNARVTAKLYSVKAVANGKLLSWEVENGDLVEQDQVLGREETLPYITSPITGTVVKNEGAANQAVAMGTELAVVADTSDLYIGVNVEETDIMKIKLGQKVDIKLDAYPGKLFKGQVIEIDPATQTYFSGGTSFTTSGDYTKVTQLIPIKVAIENQQNLPLVFGMNASVKIHLK